MGLRWSEQLELATARFHTSTTRGLGPARQSEPLNFDKLIKSDISAKVNNPRYPVAPACCIVLFTFFLLRKLECAGAEYTDMALDMDLQLITLKLSVS